MLKTQNPYGANDTYKSEAEIIDHTLMKNGGKAKARFPHKPLSTSVKNGQAGGIKTRALTPGSTPTGS